MENSFVTLGLFIIDEFTFEDEDGRPTGRFLAPQASWLGLCQQFFLTVNPPLIDWRWWNLCRNRSSYMVCFLCHRIRTRAPFIATWPRLPPSQVGMIVDRGHDFPISIEGKLLEYGLEIWLFRDQPHHSTTRANNSYKGEHRGYGLICLTCHLTILKTRFEYITPRIRLTPKDLVGTKLEKPKILHFICSPSRALSILLEVEGAWKPTTIFEPIPVRPNLLFLPTSMTILVPYPGSLCT